MTISIPTIIAIEYDNKLKLNILDIYIYVLKNNEYFIDIRLFIHHPIYRNNKQNHWYIW